MGSSKISFIINKIMKINKEKMKINKSVLCRILNKELERLRKVKRIFFFTNHKKKTEN